MKSTSACALVLALVSGCDKGTATASTGSPASSAAPVAKDPAPMASAAPVPSASPPPAPTPTCAEGYYAHAGPGFCIKLPEGVTWSRDEALMSSAGLVHFVVGSQAVNLVIGWADNSLDDVVGNGEAAAKNLKGEFENKGDLPDNRRWFRYTNRSQKGFETYSVTIAVPAGKNTLRCEVTGPMKYEKDPLVPKLIEACKTLEAR